MLSKEMLLKNALTYTKLGDYDDAKKCYKEVTTTYPDDYRGWWGLYAIDYIAYCECNIGFPCLEGQVYEERHRALKNARKLHDINIEFNQLWRCIVKKFNTDEHSSATFPMRSDDVFLNRLKEENEILLEFSKVNFNRFWVDLYNGNVLENNRYLINISSLYRYISTFGRSFYHILDRYFNVSQQYYGHSREDIIQLMYGGQWQAIYDTFLNVHINRFPRITLDSIFEGFRYGYMFYFMDVYDKDNFRAILEYYGINISSYDTIRWCFGRVIVTSFENNEDIFVMNKSIDLEMIKNIFYNIERLEEQRRQRRKKKWFQ